MKNPRYSVCFSEQCSVYDAKPHALNLNKFNYLILGIIIKIKLLYFANYRIFKIMTLPTVNRCKVQITTFGLASNINVFK